MALHIVKTALREPHSAQDRSYHRLAAQIRGLIAAGEFKPGTRLPSERSLAERFDVSRTAVREAIIALELQGAVEVRGGSGIYVTQGATASRMPSYIPATGPGPFELLRARSLVESEICALAAETHTDADLDRIFAALTRMAEHIEDKAANEAADRMFHLHIAEATGNAVLLQMVIAMWDHARSAIWARTAEHFHTTELRRASYEDHQRIFTALLNRNAGDARAAMRAHLERVISEFARNWR
jgi:DNA-binding FadR family transcriptional regulator